MSRQSLVTSVVLAALLLSLSACGDDTPTYSNASACHVATATVASVAGTRRFTVDETDVPLPLGGTGHESQLVGRNYSCVVKAGDKSLITIEARFLAPDDARLSIDSLRETKGSYERAGGVRLVRSTELASTCGQIGFGITLDGGVDASVSESKSLLDEVADELGCFSATPVQPKGADGVTIDIQNWDAYADDPVVLAWKTANEAIGASLNQGKVLAAARNGMGKDVLRSYLPSLREGWKQDWHVKAVGKVRIQSARTSVSDSQLVVCMWGSSIGFYDKKNKYVGKPENFWRKQNVKLTLSGNRWVLTSFEFDGKCPGGELS